MSITRVIGPAALLALAACTTAGAAEDVGQAYIAPMGTFIRPDANRHSDNGFDGGQLSVGFALEQYWNVEAGLQRLSLSGKNGAVDQDLTAIDLNVLNLYNRAGNISPYILAGLGVVDNSPHGASNHGNFDVQGGVGLLTNLWDGRIALRTEILARWVDTSTSSTDMVVNFGFEIPLGSRTRPTPMAANPPPPPPQSPPMQAMPPPASPPPPPPPVAPAAPRIIELPEVNFETNSDRLLHESRAELDEAAATLKSNPKMEVEVEGHTDSTGSAAYNMHLSQRRAEAVRRYLIEHDGIKANRLTAKGYGLTRPVADNATAEGRAKNRRVDLKVLKE